MFSEARRGFVAGLWGLLAMAGWTFIVKRMVETTSPVGKMHYERVVETAAGIIGRAELDDAARIRLGEMSHLAFGGFWGAVFASVTRRRRVRPWSDGVKFGAAIWLAAFAGYMPALGVSRPLWKMGIYPALRTFGSHVVFSIATFLAIRALRPEDR